MFEFGFEKIFLIMLVVLLLFGAKRIPEIGSSLGRGIRDFRRGMNDLQNDVHADLTPGPRDLTTPSTQSSRVDAQPQAETRSEPKRLLG
jgi:TatA/E family protein of Tat protein translocase